MQTCIAICSCSPRLTLLRAHLGLGLTCTFLSPDAVDVGRSFLQLQSSFAQQGEETSDLAR